LLNTGFSPRRQARYEFLAVLFVEHAATLQIGERVQNSDVVELFITHALNVPPLGIEIKMEVSFFNE
jgi:hypothetical protein